MQALSIAISLTILGSMPPSPSGYAIVSAGDDCAAVTTYFFASGRFLQVMCYAECPDIEDGTWTLKDDGIHVRKRRNWSGTPTDAVENVLGQRATYIGKSYAQRIEYIIPWKGPDAKRADPCESVVKHGRTDGIRQFLTKGTFVGRWPFTSEREVTDDDVTNLSKAELVLMRNEVYARYGAIFENRALAEHFSAQPGYFPWYTSVTAFLTDLERKNIAFIMHAEKARR